MSAEVDRDAQGQTQHDRMKEVDRAPFSVSSQECDLVDIDADVIDEVQREGRARVGFPATNVAATAIDTSASTWSKIPTITNKIMVDNNDPAYIDNLCDLAQAVKEVIQEELTSPHQRWRL